MKIRKHDKIFFEFPLCLLTVVEDSWINQIRAFCIVDYSINSLNPRDIKAVKIEKDPEDFVESNLYHNNILNSAQLHHVKLLSIQKTIDLYEKMVKVKKYFYDKYGKQPYCRIGKELFTETIAGNFDEYWLRVLCAIQSKLGKKSSFKKMTKAEIMYRMWGSKNKIIYTNEIMKDAGSISPKKIKAITDILTAKKLISMYTYKRRQTYYSTRLNQEQLYFKVTESKLFWKQKQLALQDEIQSNIIDQQIKNLNDQKRKLRIVRISKNYSENEKIRAS